MKKAPKPEVYWRAQADLLAQQNPTLYKEVDQFVFNKWDGRSIGEARRLGRLLVTSLTNLYNYAESTYLSGLKKAIKLREREIRRAQNEARVFRSNDNGVS